jgi:2-iminobutanoate/2-iminopropanoate deaminase
MTKYIVVLISALFFMGCASTPEFREVISTSGAPAAIGPYSQAVRAGNTLYLAGQIPIDPQTGRFVKGGITEQTIQVLRNIQAVLNAAGFLLGDVVQCQVFLSDLNNYDAMNNIYSAYFQDGPPARAAVQVARLPKDALVEIMVTAVKKR